MGQLSNIMSDYSCDRFLHPFDVVGLLHTGSVVEDMSSIEVSSSHSCVYMRNRPLSPQSGGHAIFVRKKIAKHVKVVCDRIEHGVVWLHIASPQQPQKGLFVAFVYLPPQSSTYYHQIEGMSYDDHFMKLQQDIMMYQSKGKVMIMGDFNARTGLLNEWDLLDPHIQRHYDKRGILERKSKDPVLNSSGKRLISICESTGMFMLNGRSRSDECGLITFRSLKGKGQSVIDYGIVSRDLLLDDMQQVDLKVIPIHMCPVRALGGKYDHCPIVANVSWAAFTEVKNDSSEVKSPSLRWKHKHRRLYTDIVQTDGEVLRLFSRISDVAISVEEACDSFTAGILRAAEVLDSRVGGVVKSESRKKKISWLSAEAKHLRNRLKKAESDMPRNINVVQEIRSMYRRQVKIDRRKMIQSSRDKIKEDMTKDTKSFWKKFRKGRPAASQFSANEWSKYFDNLFNGEKCEWQSNEDFEKHCAKFEDMFGSPSEEHANKADVLNQMFSDEEIIAALKAMKLDKAVGVDGIPVEFIRQAFHEVITYGPDGKPRIHREYVIAPYLKSLFNKMFMTGVYPTQWAIGVVSPVPKPKGDMNNMDNYRAIAVGSAISKVFAQVILGRLDRWAEDGEWRAKSQFGFRKGMGTAEAVFVLRHLVDKAENNKKPLFAAFIDFKKAYDSVPRDLLWRCLQKMGVHGHMSNMLQRMYADTKLCVRVNSEFGPEFESSIGVKQGDPLSPLLFGLYIDRFVSFLSSRYPMGDVFCGKDPLQVLLYADDMVLVSHDPKVLQAYLDILNVFCEASRMTVNTAKSEVVIFFRQWARDIPRLRFGGKRLNEVKEFTYLGVVLSEKGIKNSIPKAVKRRAIKAKNALFGMMGICHGLKVFDIEVLNKLFDGIVAPSALYGAEVWGPDVARLTKDGMVYMPLEENLFLFLRMALMVGKATPHVAMLREAGKHLLIQDCCFKSIGFWNKICGRSEHCLVKKAAMESIELENIGWAWSFKNMLNMMAGVMPDLCLDGSLVQLDRKDVTQKVSCALQDLVKDGYEDILSATNDVRGSKVRKCPDHVRRGFKAFKYASWFQNDTGTPIMFKLQDAYDIRIMARFRCGMHWLATEKDRSKALGRSLRICKCCDCNDREDELHVILCSAYEDLRNMFPHVFATDTFKNLKEMVSNGDGVSDEDVKDFMNQNDELFVKDLVGFLRRSICVRDRMMMEQVQET